MLTVSELVTRIKNLLEGEIGPVIVKGEVSNLSLSATGHYYFTLSDKESSLSVALFRLDALRNPLIRSLKDGDQILCQGTIGVYAKRGTFQIIARKITPAGTGELLLKLELLKQKLAAEGLLDPTRKRPIPALPQRVAIITALYGAALQDFLEIYRRRSLWMDILVIPALVQGEDAPKSLIKALQRANQIGNIDVIVLARGGGSLEDLWAFNDENLAYAIASSAIPIISAVGHQVDTSISDLVADFRAETPSAAAEKLTAPQVVLTERLHKNYFFLTHWIKQKKDFWTLKLERGHPRRLLQKIEQQLFAYARRLQRANLVDRHYYYLPLHNYYLRLEESVQRILRNLDKQLLTIKFRCEQGEARMRSVDPTSVLKRGYSLIKDDEGKIVSNHIQYQQLPKAHPYAIHFYDGIGRGRKDV